MQTNNDVVAYILEKKILDEAALQQAIKQHQATGQSLISVLKKNKLVNEDQFTEIVAAFNNIEFVNLSPDMVDPMAAHMVTYEMATKHNIIPIKKDGQNLLVAMSTPSNLDVRNQIEIRTGFKVVPLAATPNAIRQAVRYHFNVRNVTRQAIASMRLKQDVEKENAAQSGHEPKSARISEDPVTKLVSSIIAGAIDVHASDIHIEPQKPDMRVRYRVDGLLREAIDVPESVQHEVVSHIKILANMDISQRRTPQDGHMSVEHDGRDYDLRVSSLPAVSGEKIVCRILDKSTNKWSLDDVVTSVDDNRRFRSLVQNPYGIILLTGPTGSGKTTTLYSLLQLLNTPEKNIITVEDPVEYRLDGITQVQVNAAAGRTFASALRSILRQDPDIILIGEIRDYETAEIAVSAALTGHLVLSTLHTNDAAGAISRLVNLGMPPFLVASALLGAIAQRLVRSNCSQCKQPYTPSVEELRQLSCESETDGAIQLYRGSGCDACYGTGYRGRRAIYEVLTVSAELYRFIVDQAGDDSIKKQAIKQGMKTLRNSGLEQVLSGQTTLQELRRVVDMRTE